VLLALFLQNFFEKSSFMSGLVLPPRVGMGGFDLILDYQIAAVSVPEKY